MNTVDAMFSMRHLTSGFFNSFQNVWWSSKPDATQRDTGKDFCQWYPFRLLLCFT